MRRLLNWIGVETPSLTSHASTLSATDAESTDEIEQLKDQWPMGVMPTVISTEDYLQRRKLSHGK